MTDRLAALIAAVDAADSANCLLERVEDLVAARLEGSIPKLIETLSYNNPGAAVAAVDGLIQLGSPSVPPLIEQLDRHNYTARAWAIRALSGIGDPRGLVTLLTATPTDIVASVRRAAARGLGIIKWQWFPEPLLPLAQAETASVLRLAVQADEEWGVRYAAVVGLQALAQSYPLSDSDLRPDLLAQLERVVVQDPSLAVRARGWMALQQMQAQEDSPTLEDQHSPLGSQDWQLIQVHLYQYQKQRTTVDGGLGPEVKICKDGILA